MDLITPNMSKKEKEWILIQDVIGPANKWPKWITDLFFTKNLNHAQRPLISAFVIFNGLNPEVFFPCCS